MGWFRVDHVGARVRRQGTLSVALVKSGGAHGGVSMRVRLSRDVQEVAGLTAGDTLDVEWGEHDLAGRILLAKAEGDAGAARLRWQHPDARAAVETRFGGLPDGWFPAADGGRTLLRIEPRPAVGCAWTVARTAEEGGAAIEVTLPKAWLVAPPADARPVSRMGPSPAEAPVAAVRGPVPGPVAPRPPAPKPTPAPRPTPPSRPGPAEDDPLVARAMALLAPRAARPSGTSAPAPRPPLPADKVEKAIGMIAAGKLDSEVINAVRCTPADLADCQAELSRRRRDAARAGDRPNGAAA